MRVLLVLLCSCAVHCTGELLNTKDYAAVTALGGREHRDKLYYAQRAHQREAASIIRLEHESPQGQKLLRRSQEEPKPSIEGRQPALLFRPDNSRSRREYAQASAGSVYGSARSGSQDSSGEHGGNLASLRHVQSIAESSQPSRHGQEKLEPLKSSLHASQNPALLSNSIDITMMTASDVSKPGQQKRPAPPLPALPHTTQHSERSSSSSPETPRPALNAAQLAQVRTEPSRLAHPPSEQSYLHTGLPPHVMPLSEFLDRVHPGPTGQASSQQAVRTLPEAYFSERSPRRPPSSDMTHIHAPGVSTERTQLVRTRLRNFDLRQRVAQARLRRQMRAAETFRASEFSDRERAAAFPPRNTRFRSFAQHLSQALRPVSSRRGRDQPTAVQEADEPAAAHARPRPRSAQQARRSNPLGGTVRAAFARMLSRQRSTASPRRQGQGQSPLQSPSRQTQSARQPRTNEELDRPQGRPASADAPEPRRDRYDIRLSPRPMPLAPAQEVQERGAASAAAWAPGRDSFAVRRQAGSGAALRPAKPAGVGCVGRFAWAKADGHDLRNCVGVATVAFGRWYIPKVPGQRFSMNHLSVTFGMGKYAIGINKIARLRMALS